MARDVWNCGGLFLPVPVDVSVGNLGRTNHSAAAQSEPGHAVTCVISAIIGCGWVREEYTEAAPCRWITINTIGMQTRRNQRSRKRARVAIIPALRRGFVQHFRSHLMAYVPASLPLLLFVLAHGGTLLILILIKSGVLAQDQVVHKTVVTWAVYGILPLLFCSYLCFFVLARPATGVLERKFPDWPPLQHTTAVGMVYGAGVSVALLVLLEPNTVLRFCFLFVIGMSTGLGNWFFYRRLTLPPPEQTS